MSESSHAFITLQAGEYITLIDLPDEFQGNFEVANGEVSGDIELDIKIPIDLVVKESGTVSFPLNVTVAVQRESKDDYAAIWVDLIEVVGASTQN